MSTLPMTSPALPHSEIEVVVKEMPVRLGYVPKALMEAIKRGHVCQAPLIQINMNQGIANLSGVNLDKVFNPPGGGEICDDAFDLIPIQWTFRFHRHKSDTTTNCVHKDISHLTE
jgi:hypothetical protein